MSGFMTSTHVRERIPTPQLTEARTKDSEKFRKKKMVFKKGNFSRRCVERNDRGWLKYVRDNSSKFTASTFEISDML